MNSLPLAGKTALIIHSAYGTGLACAYALAEKGARIALAGRTFDDTWLEKEFGSKGVEPLFTRFPYHSSAISPDNVKVILKDIDEKWQTGVDILVFCTEEKKAATRERVARSILPMFYITQAVLPAMLQNNWGRVIHVLQSEGLTTREYLHAGELQRGKNEESRLHYDTTYAAGMHACLHYSQSIAKMYERTGVRCHTLAQGVVQSLLTDYEMALKVQDLFRQPEAVKQEILAGKNPSQEFIAPAKVAHLVQRLCTESGDLMQGNLLHVDNGWLAH